MINSDVCKHHKRNLIELYFGITKICFPEPLNIFIATAISILYFAEKQQYTVCKLSDLGHKVTNGGGGNAITLPNEKEIYKHKRKVTARLGIIFFVWLSHL